MHVPLVVDAQGNRTDGIYRSARRAALRCRSAFCMIPSRMVCLLCRMVTAILMLYWLFYCLLLVVVVPIPLLSGIRVLLPYGVGDRMCRRRRRSGKVRSRVVGSIGSRSCGRWRRDLRRAWIDSTFWLRFFCIQYVVVCLHQHQKGAQALKYCGDICGVLEKVRVIDSNLLTIDRLVIMND